jgi:hypothetical protein
MLLIPRDLAQAAIQYLASRPAGEVHHLLGGLLALQEAPENKACGCAACDCSGGSGGEVGG